MELPPSASVAMYDEADRELIRIRLRAFMQKFGIGVPALQGKITDAAGRSPDQLPLSTLQRFIRGVPKNTKKQSSKKMRTNDTVVWMCHKFLLAVNEPDPVEEYGEAVSKFHEIGSLAQTLEVPIGEHRVERMGRSLPGMDIGSPDQFHSHLAFESVAESVYSRVSEFRYSADAAGTVPEHGTICAQGIAFSKSGSITVLMREALTRNPVSYVLQPEDDKGFRGVLVSTDFEGVPGASIASRQVRLTPDLEPKP